MLNGIVALILDGSGQGCNGNCNAIWREMALRIGYSNRDRSLRKVAITKRPLSNARLQLGAAFIDADMVAGFHC